MRIIGQIDHPRLKISVFKMDNRITVQFENEWYSQSYKFKQGLIQTLDEVKQILTPELVQTIEKHFQQMHLIGLKAIASTVAQSQEQIWDEVI
jgi:hypothetical protein